MFRRLSLVAVFYILGLLTAPKSGIENRTYIVKWIKDQNKKLRKQK